MSFVDSCSELGNKAFFRNNRFSKTLFESVFVATCKDALKNETLVTGKINKQSFEILKMMTFLYHIYNPVRHLKTIFGVESNVL